MIKTTIKNKQRGDTIIEVMVAVVILGMAFAISYATASHALQMSQNSQEHSRALQILDSQVEMVRSYTGPVDLYDTAANTYFCMYLTGSAPSQNVAATSFTTATPVSSAPSTCKPKLNDSTNYVVYTNYNPAKVGTVTQDIFTFTVTWPGIGDLGQQEEQISYKLHQ